MSRAHGDETGEPAPICPAIDGMYWWGREWRESSITTPSRTRAPCTPSTRPSSMSLVAEGPETSAGGSEQIEARERGRQSGRTAWWPRTIPAPEPDAVTTASWAPKVHCVPQPLQQRGHRPAGAREHRVVGARDEEGYAHGGVLGLTAATPRGARHRCRPPSSRARRPGVPPSVPARRY